LIVWAAEGIIDAVSQADDTLDTLQGTLDLLVLRALKWGPRHGYAVAQFIREGSGGEFRVLDGALYTSLHRLAERRLVDSEWGISEKGKRARFYELTTAGRRALRAEISTWERYVAAVAGVLTAVPDAV
jgi:PadR family transcriptional regulator, regulatory protein PadR